MHVRIKDGVCAPQGKNSQDRIHAGVTLRRWQRRWFSGIFEVIREDRAISANTAVRLGKYFGLHPRNLGSLFRTTTISDLQRAAVIAANSPALARA